VAGVADDMRTRPPLTDYLERVERLKASEFDLASWAKLINQMRIDGYGIHTEDLIIYVREQHDRTNNPGG